MKKEREYLRELGKKVAEIAALPVQAEKKALWTANNDLRPVRPMVYIDQLPWHEIKRAGHTVPKCSDPFLSSIEEGILRILYRWEHFPCDMVVENRIDIPKTVRNLDYGIHIEEESLRLDSENDVYSHAYRDQLSTPEALDLLRPDIVAADSVLDKKHLEICEDIFGGVIPLRLAGVQIHSGVWDRVAQMRPAEAILYDLADRPEFIAVTVKKLVALTMSTVDQCETLGLLDAELPYVHCTGAWTESLPPKDYNPEAPRAKDCWSFGMAQLFAAVSPAAFEEFEIELVKPLYERFGLLYYGCCEPLEKKIGLVRKIKNVRKISVSPWANIEECSLAMGKDYVLSLKSNPAFIARGFDEEGARRQIERALATRKRDGGALEIILKDVSTVSGNLDVLRRWNDLAMGYALG